MRSRTVVCLRDDDVSDDCDGDAPDNTETCSVDTCDNTENEYQEDDTEDDYNDEEYKEDDDDDAVMERSTKAVPVRYNSDAHLNIINDIVPESTPTLKDQSCRDNFKNCNIVVQSRLCNYSFYQSNCCRSCALSVKRS